ncbi:MAG: DNA repair protein RadA [Spirochaetia bacterium]|nr:DNA repair protein RadA [Spirochaetia bacterium]
MKKDAIVFVCSECGHSESKWLGRCPDCGSWNSFNEQNVVIKKKGNNQPTKIEAQLVSMKEIVIDKGFRFTSNISEFDRVLGGSIMHGGSILIGGEPGIGKSTLMLQVVASLDQKKAIYVSGEESNQQVRTRCERLELPLSSISLFNDTRLGAIQEVMDKEKPDVMVIDSLQTLYSEEIASPPGSVNQMRMCAMELSDSAKQHGCAIFFVGHITKDGQIAGPKVIEHIVDTVLYFELSDNGARIIRASKNRFGSIDEIGIFLMSEKGLIPVADPAGFFLNKRSGKALPAGIAFGTMVEGSRTFLVEIQALTIPVKGGGYSRIYSERIDNSLVSRIAAVLERHGHIAFSQHDIYVNVAGGIKLKEVAIELPLALALYSAISGNPLPPTLVSMGELSLAGEVRPVGLSDKRIKGALDMGFSTILLPEATTVDEKGNLLRCETLNDALDIVKTLSIRISK